MDPRDSDRQRVLDATGLLDTPPEPAFDRLTRLAARLIGAPVAMVSLIDAHRQFFKSAIGLAQPWADARETPLSHAFCLRVVEDRAALIVTDSRRDARVAGNGAIVDLGVIAYAGTPLVIEGEAIGALCVVDHVPRTWTDAELDALRDLAGSVVSEIELRVALRQAREQRALLATLVESVGDAVIAVGRDRHYLVANAAARAMFVHDIEVGGAMPTAWPARHESRYPDGRPITADEGAVARGLRGLDTDGLRFSLARPDAAPSWVEAIGRPVRDATGEVVAAVAVYRDVTSAQRLAAERERQLLVDPMTGIANRRAADAALAVEESRMRRFGVPLSVAVIDIDHFKRVNDHFGHATGDDVIRQVAAALVAEARATDLIARWGGEEFLAILPMARAGARAFCERARRAVEAMRHPAVGAITVSIGAVEVVAPEAVAEAIARADARLYEAKRAGRNRVIA